MNNDPLDKVTSMMRHAADTLDKAAQELEIDRGAKDQETEWIRRSADDCRRFAELLSPHLRPLPDDTLPMFP